MSTENENTQFNFREWVNDSCSLSFKIFFIIILILVMLIPKSMVEDLVYERKARSIEAVNDVSSKWGGSQVIDGPVISIPIKSKTSDRKFIHLLSKSLIVNAKIDSEERSRGIFSAILYSSTIDLKGSFHIPQAIDIGLNEGALDYSRAFLSVGISDPLGIAEGVKVEIDGNEHEAKPGLPVDTGMSKGFHIPLNILAGLGELSISAELKINGSEQLEITPTGNNTEVSMTSNWKDPSFTGSFLPVKRDVKESGFTASWKVHDLQGNTQNTWFDNNHTESKQKCGVKLIQVNDVYQRIIRVIKYAILFISFTFAAVFISERLTKMSIHPLQYLLTGLASLFFYVFLLSLSEHLSFNAAYGLTSLVITTLIAGYAKAIFRSLKMAFTIGGVCSFLYLFLFGTLQLEDYALLMGSCGLLFILALVMYLTRSINSDIEFVRA